MYTITIYNKDFSTAHTTLFHGPDFSNLQYDLQLMKPGGLQFRVQLRNAKATPDNFQLFNKVILSEDGTDLMITYIENLSMDTNTMDITCTGILGLFKKRLYSANLAGDSATAFEAILTATNAIDDTGITFGTSDVVDTITDVKFNRSTILAAWSKLANLAGSEFIINGDKTLDFLQEIGTDQSASVVLRYRVTQINMATLNEFSVDVEGKDMTNKVVGLGSGGITDVQQSAASITKYGVLESSKSLIQTDDATDLATETANFVANHKEEFYAPSIVVNTSKIDASILGIGDTVTVDLNNGFIEVNGAYRIIKKMVSVSNNLTEEVNLELMAVGINVLPNTPFEDIVSIEDRVSLLESEL